MPGTAATGRCWASGGCAANSDEGFEYLQCRGTCPELQLAAELGNSLLEKNKTLELTLRDQQTLVDEQSQEIEHLRRRVFTLKTDCDGKSRLCEQLESSLQDLEAACRQLETDRAQGRARVKSLQDTIQELEQRCLDYEESRLTNGVPATSPTSSQARDCPTMTHEDSSGNSSLQEEDAEESAEVARLKATLSRTKSQLARAQREKRELELELRLALEENVSLHKEIEFSTTSRRQFKKEMPNGDSLELTADNAIFEFDHDSDFSKEECSLVRLDNGIVAFGCQESLSSLSSNGAGDVKEDNSSLFSELTANNCDIEKKKDSKMINLQFGPETLAEDLALDAYQGIAPLNFRSDRNIDDQLPEQDEEGEKPEFKRLFKELFALLRNPPLVLQCTLSNYPSMMSEKSTNTDNSSELKPLLSQNDTKPNETNEIVKNYLHINEAPVVNYKENIFANFPEDMQTNIVKAFLYRSKLFDTNDFVPMNGQCACPQAPKIFKNASTNTDTIIASERKYKIVVKITEPSSRKSSIRINQERKSSVQSTQTSQNDFPAYAYIPSQKSEFLEATNRYFEDTYEDIKVLVNKGVSTHPEEDASISSNGSSQNLQKLHKDIFPTSPSRVKQIIKMFQSQALG